jgi:hypothetical protein
MRSVYSVKKRKNIPIKDPKWNLIGYYHWNGESSAFDEPLEARQYIRELVQEYYPRAKDRFRPGNGPAFFYVAIAYTAGRKNPRKAANIFEYKINPGCRIMDAAIEDTGQFAGKKRSRKAKITPFVKKILEEEKKIRIRISSNGNSLASELKKYCNHWSTKIPYYTTHDET